MELRWITAKGAAVAALIAALVGLNLVQFFFPRRMTDERVIERFHELSYEEQFGYFWSLPPAQWPDPPGYTPNRWLGVIALQNPPDAWIHQEIITEVKPDYIIETGTYTGGSAALWAMVLREVNPAGRVITIDIEDQFKEAKALPVFKERVDFLLGSSTDPKVVAEVEKRVKGKRVLVTLDSLHTKDHVLAEIKAYGPLVSVGSYLIVQDTNFNGHPVVKHFGPGPFEAVEEFLATNDQFVPDRSRERFLFTTNPNGYLKRVK